MINQLKDLLDENLLTYTPNDLYGIFYNGRRISVISGKFYWDSVRGAKMALSRSIKWYYNCKYYQDKYNFKLEDAERFDVNKLIKIGIIEIKKVGNT